MGSVSSPPKNGARKLRQLLKDPDNIVVAPGVYDGISARIALSQGFDALYMVSRSVQRCSTLFVAYVLMISVVPVDRSRNLHVPARMGGPRPRHDE